MIEAWQTGLKHSPTRKSVGHGLSASKYEMTFGWLAKRVGSQSPLKDQAFCSS